MTNDALITCPKCSHQITLTDSLRESFAKEVEQKYKVILEKHEESIKQRERELEDKNSKLQKEEEFFDKKLQDRLEKERQKLQVSLLKEAEEKAKRHASIELENNTKKLLESEKYIKTLQQKLSSSQEKELALITKERSLSDEKREMQLTIEKEVQEKMAVIREKAQKQAEESMLLRVKEKDLAIEAMNKTILELQRKATQGSQQAQGEVQELQLESILTEKFINDIIEPVAKGECGGDIIQYVQNATGSNVGKLLWESKRTKNWNNDWIGKLKADQRSVDADIAIIVTQTLPKNTKSFEQIDGVWVIETEAVIPLATILRKTLAEVFRVKKISQGQKTKQEILYTYLTGDKFRGRISVIIEIFTSMQKELEKERRVITKQWDKRRMHIDNVIDATVGMHGDLQAIVGEALKEVEGLDLKFLEYDNKE